MFKITYTDGLEDMIRPKPVGQGYETLDEAEEAATEHAKQHRVFREILGADDQPDGARTVVALLGSTLRCYVLEQES